MALYARVSGSSTLSSVKENIFHVSLNDLRANTLKNLLIYYYNFKLYNSLDIFSKRVGRSFYKFKQP